MPRSVVEAGLSDQSVGLDRHGRRHPGARVKQKLLLVDDSGLARRSMRAILESDGFEVVEAEDGMVALERYFIEKPDVVMLDLVMKGMYGLDVLTKLRELDSDGARDRRVGRRAELVAADGRSGRRERLHQQAGRSRAAPERGPQRARRRVLNGAHRRSGGRADRAAEHRLRPGRGVAVAADRPPRPARSAARHDSSGRRGGRIARARASTPTSPACTRFSPVRSPATRC